MIANLSCAIQDSQLNLIPRYNGHTHTYIYIYEPIMSIRNEDLCLDRTRF